MRELVLFQTGKTAFALDRDSISRIRPIPESATQGKVRIQQRTIEDDEKRTLVLFDLAAVSNQVPESPYPPNAEMIVVNESPPIALLADRLKSVLKVTREQMDELPPVFGDTARAHFPKVLCTEDQVALVIDPDALTIDETYTEKTLEQPKDQQTIGFAEDRQTRGIAEDRQTIGFAEDRQTNGTTEDRQNGGFEGNEEPEPTRTEEAATCTPLVGDHFEALVGEKLRQIIEKRVQEVTAETMARALTLHTEQQFSPPQQ